MSIDNILNYFEDFPLHPTYKLDITPDFSDEDDVNSDDSGDRSNEEFKMMKMR